MDTSTILKHLKTHGQLMDYEIAEAIKTPIGKVRPILTDLAARGEIFGCHVTRFPNGKPVEGMQFRITGFRPAAAPGRKTKPNKQASPSEVTQDDDLSPADAD